MIASSGGAVAQPICGSVDADVDAFELAEQVLGCRPRVAVEPGAVAELDGEQVVGVAVASGEQPFARLGPVGQPGRELVVDGDQLAAGAQRLQRRHEVALLIGRRLPRDPVLALVAGEAPIGLDVEAEVAGVRSTHPSTTCGRGIP